MLELELELELVVESELVLVLVLELELELELVELEEEQLNNVLLLFGLKHYRLVHQFHPMFCFERKEMHKQTVQCKNESEFTLNKKNKV